MYFNFFTPILSHLNFVLCISALYFLNFTQSSSIFISINQLRIGMMYHTFYDSVCMKNYHVCHVLIFRCSPSWKTPISFIMSIRSYLSTYISVAPIGSISVIFYPGHIYENLLRKSKFGWNKANIRHFTSRPRYILSLLVTFNQHKSAFFEWNGIRLLGDLWRHKYYTNMSHALTILFIHNISHETYVSSLTILRATCITIILYHHHTEQ